MAVLTTPLLTGLLAAYATSTTIPASELLEESYVECFITGSDSSRRGMQRYYKCGDWSHFLSDPLFRGSKEGAREFEECFTMKASVNLHLDVPTFQRKYDLEAIIKELKCNPSPEFAKLATESPLAVISRRVEQFKQRFQTQFAELAAKVKPEWIECFGEQQNVTVRQFFCDKSHVAMSEFKHCIASSFRRNGTGLVEQGEPSTAAENGRLQKAVDWIVGKVICKPQAVSRKRSVASDWTDRKIGALVDAIGVVPAILLLSILSATVLTALNLYNPVVALIFILTVYMPLMLV